MALAGTIASNASPSSVTACCSKVCRLAASAAIVIQHTAPFPSTVQAISSVYFDPGWPFTVLGALAPHAVAAQRVVRQNRIGDLKSLLQSFRSARCKVRQDSCRSAPARSNRRASAITTTRTLVCRGAPSIPLERRHCLSSVPRQWGKERRAALSSEAKRLPVRRQTVTETECVSLIWGGIVVEFAAAGALAGAGDCAAAGSR